MLTLLLTAAFALPPCYTRGPDQTTAQAVPADRPDVELLARLVVAEATSTGFPDDPTVHRGIAWGAVNRVRLAAASPTSARHYGRGVRGVIFHPGQFNPAVSTRSPFAQHLLCPTDAARWALAEAAATEALSTAPNPFVQTDWEKAHGLSLVVNFYYPASIQAKGPTAPWETSTALRFLGDVTLGTAALPASRVRFYRLTTPPSDVPR